MTKNFSSTHQHLTAHEKITNIVLILGESTRRDHMQIYGYPYPTTPYLKNISSTPNLIIYHNVISPHAHTILSLRKVLTFLNYENEESIPIPYQLGNLISIYNAAHYSTFWISNQLDSLHGGGIIDTIASMSTQSIFPSKFKQHFDEVDFDEVLLPFIKEKIETNQKDHHFFIIHLMGTHASYGNRYPKKFAFFEDSLFKGNKRLISRYDNAILYQDFIITQIFQLFSQQDSIVLYLSDHAEELYDKDQFIGHSDDRISQFMVEIPMLIYTSNIFIKKHPLLYHSLKNAKNIPYMSDDLIHTILDISKINDPSFEQQRSIINQNFNPLRQRIIGGKNGIDYDTIQH